MGQLSTVANSGEILALQGGTVPVLRLHRLFNVPGATTNPLDAIVVILEDEGKQIGLMVDELLGQQQTVIKSLGASMKGIPGIAGGAIMADGTVGLILDINGVAKLAQQRVCGETAA
jgi:two-component system chemotaxis sensor kinase CheA